MVWNVDTGFCNNIMQYEKFTQSKHSHTHKTMQA